MTTTSGEGKKSLSRKETAKYLGISERTLVRQHPGATSFYYDSVERMKYVLDLKRKIRISIKAGKEVRRSIKELMKKIWKNE